MRSGMTPVQNWSNWVRRILNGKTISLSRLHAFKAEGDRTAHAKLISGRIWTKHTEKICWDSQGKAVHQLMAKVKC